MPPVSLFYDGPDSMRSDSAEDAWLGAFFERWNMPRTAILVDGGFYRRVARTLWGQKGPKERADVLYEYCIRHITSPREARVELGKRDLYRLFYYDCPPVRNVSVWHPLLQRNRNFKPSDESYKWSSDFFENFVRVLLLAGRLVRVESVGGVQA